MQEERKTTRKKGGFLKGAIWIAFGGFVAKVIGAFYRIPLTNFIGGEGLGLYQMIYPAYCLLLTLSATGIPSSISKLTAEKIGKGQNEKSVFKTAMWLFLLIGLCGSILMALIAPILARAQGIEEVVQGYYALAPSVFLVSGISVFRGWFQGKENMFPTAISEIIEQAVKVAIGLLFAYLYRTNIQKAVIFLLLSVSISELVALLVMIIIFRRAPAPLELKNDGDRVGVKTILKLSIPVTLSAMLLPLSGILDSVLVPRLLGCYTERAITLYGLFSGGAVTIINLPVSICYGIAVASIPAVARAQAQDGSVSAISPLPMPQSGNDETQSPLPIEKEENLSKVVSHETPPLQKRKRQVRKRIFFSLMVTALVGIPSAILVYFFAQPAVEFLYKNLSEEDKTVLVELVKKLSVSAFLLSCTQTLSACLTAQGKPQHSAFSMGIAVVVKTVTYAILLQRSEISVFGLAYATNLCYLVAFLLDFMYNIRASKVKKEGKKHA